MMEQIHKLGWRVVAFRVPKPEEICVMPFQGFIGLTQYHMDTTGFEPRLIVEKIA